MGLQWVGLGLVNSGLGSSLRQSRMLDNCLLFLFKFIWDCVMGNKQSEQPKQFAIQINHPRFSKSKIITKEGQKLLQASQPIDEKDYNKWQAGVKSKFQGTIPPNLLLPKSQSFERAGLCGNTGTLLVNYDNYPYLLVEEIYNRKGLKSKFSEEDVWFLLFSLVEARNQAQAVGERLGDIRPKNIFLNEGGQIKVSNSLSWPQELSNIQKSFDKTPTYLAPQDLEKLGKGIADQAPSQVSQAFSIGLTILSCGNLTEYEQLYDLKGYEINGGRFNESLGLWARNSGYSQVLRGTVLLLLNLHPQKRLNCQELNELLGKHAEFILKRENFVIDNAPLKLHEEIQHLRAVNIGNVQPFGIPPTTLITSEYRLDLPNYELIKPQRQQHSP